MSDPSDGDDGGRYGCATGFKPIKLSFAFAPTSGAFVLAMLCPHILIGIGVCKDAGHQERCEKEELLCTFTNKMYCFLLDEIGLD